MIAMAEEELARLQRQLRIMEDDRKAFSEETNTKLEKQRKIIQRLKDERAKLYEDINIATCDNQRRKDEKLSKDIYKLLSVYDDYCEKVKVQKEDITEMDIQIKKLEADIRSLRPKSSITDNHFQSQLTTGQKTVKMLQNRLDNMVKKFCAILASNKELREEIDHLLKERNHFNEIWEKLLKDVNAGKKYMVDLIEQAIIAFDQREEWCSKLIALKKRTEMDFVIHSEEMREIQRRLDHYMTLREFLCVKGQKRILKDLEEKERLKKESQIQDLENQLHVYEETLTKIQTFCNEEDIERIASQFLKQEEENFALFNYVNELGHELETLSTAVDDIHEKIDEQIEISAEKAKQRQHTITSLQEDLKIATQQANNDEGDVKNTEQDILKVLHGIEEVFRIIDCDRGPILKLLSENSEINLFNVKIYLGTIEKKLSSIITELYFAEKSMLKNGKKAIGY
ncbi:coiled-coil domain-containing protein 63 [Sitophilus oryzae]|uniref:Coiled-coil domain-containing protein 63 n=1 Tax=Sitophilus oryzae TaxID=7048 RepID=A0A6J2X8P6_SITOR|nr:coiled-coil domain-containing protein 63 [Sitophilus oryzae]